MKRIGIYVDVSNLYFCLQREHKSRKLDYKKFYDFAKDFGEVKIACAYGSQIGVEAQTFISRIEAIGFKTRYKEPKEWPTSAPGRSRRKADWDVGITIDVIEQCDQVDTVVLGCADGDLAPLVEYLTARGKAVIVIACRISSSLRETATTCIEIPESLLEGRKRKKHETT
jgi:uncharacterized LabA/DUF88 family protein